MTCFDVVSFRYGSESAVPAGLVKAITTKASRMRKYSFA